MYKNYPDKVVLITRTYKDSITRVVALDEKSAAKWIEGSKIDDLDNVKYETERVWLV